MSRRLDVENSFMVIEAYHTRLDIHEAYEAFRFSFYQDQTSTHSTLTSTQICYTVARPKMTTGVSLGLWGDREPVHFLLGDWGLK